MNIAFEDKALEELYLKGRTSAKRYARLSLDVVKRYAKVVNYMKNEDIMPFVATHPGELVRDEMKERGLTQKQLAAMTGLSTAVISELVRAKRSVTTEIATSLEKALGIPVAMWMNLQEQYSNDVVAQSSQQESVVVTIPVSDRNLLRDLSRKFGWACMM